MVCRRHPTTVRPYQHPSFKDAYRLCRRLIIPA
jgi:hypothetical protein